MTTELVIANRRLGKLWNIANITETATWETNRTGTPGVFKFSLIKSGDIDFSEGDQVRFSVDGQLQFFGFVFTKEKDRWGVIDVTCYDRLRYLKASASYAFYGQTAGQIIRKIAADFQLSVGAIDDTGYAIPSYIQDNKTCLDIIGGAVQQTLLNTGKVFVFFDDGNGLALREAGKMISDVVIGEKSLLTDYKYKTDIDQQTYNSVKLVRPNKTTGRVDAFEAIDSATISEWGLLRLYQTIDENVNDAQAKSQVQTTLKYYDRRMRTMHISSIGVPGLRAGQMVLMKIPGLGDINLDQYVMLEKVSHTWENDKHTMEFDTFAI